MTQHITVLRWTDKELLTMLCKRLGFYLCRNYSEKPIDLSKFDSIDNALSFCKKYFSDVVKNQAFDIEEKIVPYILRHTLLTPRQVILLCNEIVKQAQHQNIFPHRPIPDSYIRKGIEICEENLCKEVFDAFKKTYPYPEEFCTEYLRHLRMSFRVASIRSEVPKKIDGNNDKYITDKNDYILLEKMLFDLGIIGVENRENTVSNTYNIAIFEPNRDGRISPNPNDNLFVHPMFIHKINFVRDPEACSKPVCPVQAVSTKKLLS